MGESKVAAFFAPVGNFFEKRYEAVTRDAERLERSVSGAADAYLRDDLLDLPLHAANIGIDTLRSARRFSMIAPASIGYGLIRGQEQEEALFDAFAERARRPAVAARLGLELGLLGFANWNSIVVADRLAGADITDLKKENENSLLHAVAKAEAHLPERVAEKFQVLEHVEGREQEDCWAAALAYLKSQGKDLPYEKISTYSDFLGYLEAGGITYHNRVGSIEYALQLVDNRRRLSSLGKDRPIAVVVANKNDSNNAFSARYSPLLDQLGATEKFDVVYIEVTTDREAVAAVLDVYRASGQKISLVAFAGHGTGETIRFGGGDEEETFLDVDDFTSKPEFTRDLDLAIAEDGQIFLDACATGSPKVSENLMRVVARALPGRDVFGTSIDNSLKEVKFQGGRIRDVKWDWGHREYLRVPREGEEEVVWSPWKSPVGSVVEENSK